MSGSQMAGRTFCFVCRQVKWTSNVFLFAFETLQGYICTRSVYSSTMVRTTYSLPVFWFYGHYLNVFFLSFHVKQTLTFHLNLLSTLKGYIITKIASSVIICRLCFVLKAAFQMARSMFFCYQCGQLQQNKNVLWNLFKTFRWIHSTRDAWFCTLPCEGFDFMTESEMVGPSSFVMIANEWNGLKRFFVLATSKKKPTLTPL